MTTYPYTLSECEDSHCPKTAVQDEQQIANAGEKELLEKMTELVKGIAPSSCKLSCAEMWDNIQRHKDLLQLPNTKFPVFQNNPKVYYLNSSKVSEGIADLSMKLQSKFVQSETSSSYSIWAETTRQVALALNSRRPFNGISPGRRLSHLARRRQMFSKANLQQLALNEPKNRLAIKTTVAQRNLAKDYLDYKQNIQPAIPKRALFQSPDEPPVRPGFQTVTKRVPRRRLFADLNKNGPVQELPHGGGSYDVSSWLASQPFVNNRKRGREDPVENTNPKRRCPRRSLDFSDASPSQASQVSSQSSTPTLALTNIHKQKLLWAVATALKEKQITHKHPEFKDSAKKLFNLCRKNLTTILALQVPSGTSEKMLSYARQHMKNVINISEDLSKSEILIAGGKENVNRTPRRLIKPRTWRSCIKSGRKPRGLNRSLSCDDLKGDLKIGCKRKRELLDDSREAFKDIGNTPKKSEILTTVIKESPEVDDFCVQASQEDLESCLFPALVKNHPMPKSPDLFDDDEPERNFSSLEVLPQTNVLENIPIDESACPDDFSELLDLSCVRNDNTQLGTSTIENNTEFETSNIENEEFSGTNYEHAEQEIPDINCEHEEPEISRISYENEELEHSRINYENEIPEVSGINYEHPDPQISGINYENDKPEISGINYENDKPEISGINYENDKPEISGINYENTEPEFSGLNFNTENEMSNFENQEGIVADVEDNVNDTNPNESLSDDEDQICTSTPMVAVPKRILRRNKKTWKVETGPGLKVRVRLSKEWDIVGRPGPGNSCEFSNPEIDLKETPVETQIKNPLMRLNSVDTTGSSTDNYNLMELRDKLHIEQTLAADPSEMSFFESSCSSESSTHNEVATIVEISPEVTINCYKRKRFSVYESDSSEDDDGPLRGLKSEDENLPLSQLIETNLDRNELFSEDENLPLIELIEPKLDKTELASEDENLPLSQLADSKFEKVDNLPLTEREASEDEYLPLSQLADSKLDKPQEAISEDENVPLSELAKQKVDSEDDLPLNQLCVQDKPKEQISAVKKLTLETYKARRGSNVSSESSTPKKIYNIRLKKKKRSPKVSNDENANPAMNVQATIENSERIIQQTFSEFAFIIHQKMQSTIMDSTDLESKIEKLNKLIEMSIVQQQLFAYFKQKTLEIKEQLSPLNS